MFALTNADRGRRSWAPAAGLALALLLLGCGDDEPSPADAGTQPDAGQRGLCSGCEKEPIEPDGLAVHVHHVHLNVRDRERSAQFYATHFGAEPVRLNGTSDALLASPILLLLDEWPDAPLASLPTALQHIGFGASDPLTWYERAHEQGVQPDTRGHTVFNTNETPTVAGPGSALETTLQVKVPACFPILDEIAYMYVLGPDDERIELWSGEDEHVNHVHFTASNVEAALAFYRTFLGLELGGSSFFLDGLLFFFEPDGEAGDYAPTDDHVLGHLAFSVTDLDAFRQRASEQDIEVVSEPDTVHGFRSFFVRGPDGILIELVEAAPLAGLCEPG